MSIALPSQRKLRCVAWQSEINACVAQCWLTFFILPGREFHFRNFRSSFAALREKQAGTL
jgi:hypothetical protein